MIPQAIRASAPKVFISFASADLPQAQRLNDNLQQHNIATFFAPRDLASSGNIPVVLSRKLAESDYFVLLVSTNSMSSPWVELEWTAALAREINERRAFLFLLRLDGAPPPLILSARNYLDGYRDWNTAVNRLVEVWQRDWETRQRGIRVVPPPGPARRSLIGAGISGVEQETSDIPSGERTLPREDSIAVRQKLVAHFSEEELRTLCFDIGVDYESLPAMGKEGKARELVLHLERRGQSPELVALCRQLRPNAFWPEVTHVSWSSTVSSPTTQPVPWMIVYIFNQAFSIQHVMRVAPTLTGRQLYAQVRVALALNDQVEALGGQVGLRFTYTLLHNGTHLLLEQPLSKSGIEDGTSLDLIISMEQFGPDGNLTPVVFRGPREDVGPSKLSRELIGRLIEKAFGHLL
jgi:hypothetical protein